MSHVSIYANPNAVGMIADSMAHGEIEKEDNLQKLYVFGNNLFTATGPSEIVDDLKRHSKRLNGRSVRPSDFAEAIIDHAKESYDIRAIGGVDVFVAGKARKGFEAYRVALGRIHNPIQIDPYWSAGAAGDLVEKTIERDENRGIVHTEYSNLDDICDFLLDCGLSATQSTRANDFFQFGLLSDQGLRVLYHPDVQLDIPPPNYVDNNGNLDGRKKEVNDQVYAAFMELFAIRYILRSEYNNSNHVALLGGAEYQTRDPEQIKADFDEVRKVSQTFFDKYQKLRYTGFGSRSMMRSMQRKIASLMEGNNLSEQQVKEFSSMTRAGELQKGIFSFKNVTYRSVTY